MKVVITGGAGFLGSNLLDKLIVSENNILVIDNLSTGVLDNISSHLEKKNFNFLKADLKKPSEWISSFKDIGVVLHYAANPDVETSYDKPEIYFNENVISTFNLLEAVRKYGVKYLIFSSSSTVYGEPKIIPTPENYMPLKPISIYGVSKLICEEMIETYARLYGFKYVILRYANIIGRRSQHGVVYDFVNKLRKNKKVLEILGDGTQKKSYMYVDDAVNATLYIMEMLIKDKLSHKYINIGSEDWITVLDIADIVVKEMGLDNVVFHLNPQTSDGRGWIGDVKLMMLDTALLKSMGYHPKYSSREAVKIAVKEYLESVNKV